MKEYIAGLLLFVGIWLFSVTVVALHGYEAYMVTTMSVILAWGLRDEIINKK